MQEQEISALFQSGVVYCGGTQVGNPVVSGTKTTSKPTAEKPKATAIPLAPPRLVVQESVS